MKHTHFTKRKFLEGIGKPLLQELFTSTDSNGSALTSTLSPDLPDKDYFDAVAKLAMNPEQLPDSIQEAFYAIEEMATVEGQDLLQSALDSEGIHLELPEDSTLGDFATRVFLKHPTLVATKHVNGGLKAVGGGQPKSAALGWSNISDNNILMDC